MDILSFYLHQKVVIHINYNQRSEPTPDHLHSLLGELVPHHHLGESWVWLDPQWVGSGVISVPE